MENTKPFINSFFGFSNVAQLAHDIAFKIEKENIVEITYIVGVTGKVRTILRKSQSV